MNKLLKIIGIFIILIAFARAAENIDSQLQPLFKKLSTCKFTVSSGDRSPQKNKEVGGAPKSFHLQKARARDIVSTEECRNKLGKEASKNGLSTIYYSKHIHIDNREDQVCLEKSGTGFINCREEK